MTSHSPRAHSTEPTISFFVNGQPLAITNPDPEITLAYYLRNTLKLTGTKLACEQGACGSCTIVIGKKSPGDEKPRFFSANACLLPLYLVDGTLILTVEGVGSLSKLHPIQERISRGHGTQCGFCSPGFVMSAYALLRNNPRPSMDEIRCALTGNLCRCTGYRPIIEAVRSFAEQGCCGGGGAGGGCPCKDGPVSGGEETKLVDFSQFAPYDPSQDIIFPPELLIEGATAKNSIELHGQRLSVYLPSSIEVLCMWLQRLPKFDRIVATGIITKLYSLRPGVREVWISTARIHALHDVSVGEEEIEIGSALSISEMLTAISTHCTNKDYVTAIQHLYKKYSSMQVRNMASWSGALVAAMSKYDTCTLFLGAGWKLRILNARTGSPRVVTAAEFYAVLPGSPAQTKTSLGPDDVILGLIVPKNPNTTLFTFKHGKRLGPDEAVVNCVAALDHASRNIHVVMGIYRKAAYLEITSKACTEALQSGHVDIEKVFRSLDEDLAIYSILREFQYKKQVARAAVEQLIDVLINKKDPYSIEEDDINYSSLQVFKPQSSATDLHPVGKPVAHVSADRHVTGEADYINDLQIGDLHHAALVLSSVAHGHIVTVDARDALTLPGVVGYVDARDVPHKNRPGTLPIFLLQDETPIFADPKDTPNGPPLVEMVGQPIGAIIAKDVVTARQAAKMVKVKYEEMEAVVTLEQAIASDSRLVKEPVVFGKEVKDVEEGLKGSNTVMSGRLSIGGQEHVYMETQSAIAVPHEANEWTIHTSSQSPMEAQYLVAETLGISACNIVIKCKRLGGAFGAKGTGDRLTRGPAVVAAAKIGKPVSCVLTREDDITTGKRHATLFDYRIGHDANGRITAVHVKAYLNGGFASDHTPSVAFVMGSTMDACFDIPCFRAEAHCMKTNTFSGTAFRGYGRPQSFFFMEAVLNRIAHALKKHPAEIKQLNFAHCGDTNLMGFTIRNDSLEECWAECLSLSAFESKKKEVAAFNASSKRIKRGVAVSATRHGLPVPGAMEQGTAFVQLLLDGSVRVNVGTVEMGQGLNTKMAQIAATVFKIPLSSVVLLENATDKTANTPESGGSIGTDINGWAVKKACERLLKGVAPHIQSAGGDWTKGLHAAFQARVPLQASETIQMDHDTYKIPEHEHLYYTTGAACVVAEVDCSTGEQKLLSVDIVMDVGESINPAIDVGQIEGGFMQGYGLMTCEELEHDPKGGPLNANINEYKIPTIHMVPEKLRVKLLEKGKNFDGQIFRSKGIGEPPLLLGTAAYSAIREAITSYRGEGAEWHDLSAPLSARKILEACHSV